ncbi:MAG: PASTA domain-containing protein [Elusimicrobium sp.]|uniref:PASTA domain-containing protein n=1 Tax=Candidatus Avelusimicrobium gallicola TaxID=2562704 RepID=A0A928DR73_9BACT|nr:PASTA domain-containing protein [Elusimicrobium sp.]
MPTDNQQNFDDFLNKPKKSGRTKWIVAGVIAAFFAALIFVSIDWVFGALVHTRKEVTVPDITKKPITQALDMLAAQNLALKQAGIEYAQDVPPGSVLRQIPSAGSTVREGRVIRVWISQGDEMVFVPNTVGTDLRAAQLAVRQAGLLVDKVENAYSLTYEKGLIVAQTPKADSMVQKGEKVSLTLSNGAPPSSVVLVPNFKSKKLAVATLWASSQNINLIIREDKDSVFPNGTIAEQRPAADTQIAPGTNVEVIVSRREVADNEKTYHLHYEMPQGKNASRVRVVLEDETGENEILNETKQPGSKIDLEIPYSGKATVRVFTDGILVREREVL